MKINNDMKKQLKQLALGTVVALGALATVASAQAEAFNRVGNGGDAVICGDDVYMLDYVEEYGDDPRFEKHGDIGELAAEIIQVSKEKDAYLFRRLNEVAKRFLIGIEEYESAGNTKTQTVEFTESKLSNVADEGYYKVPHGCSIEQLIIRKESNALDPAEFIVNKNLWDKMSDYQKAVAVSHEAIYKYMIDGDQLNSLLTRQYNRSFLTGAFARLSDETYTKLMRQNSIDHNQEFAGVAPIPRYSHQPSFYSNGEIKSLQARSMRLKKSIREVIPANILVKQVFFAPGRRISRIQGYSSELLKKIIPLDHLTPRVPFDVINGKLITYQSIYEPWLSYIAIRKDLAPAKKNIYTIGPEVAINIDDNFIEVEGICEAVVRGGSLSSTYKYDTGDCLKTLLIYEDGRAEVR